MPSFRTQRINEEVRREIEAIIATAVKDPGLSGMVSVVRAEVTRDLAHAKIYISVYGDKAQLDSAIEGLARANGFIRRELAQGWNFAACRNFILWRMIPLRMR